MQTVDEVSLLLLLGSGGGRSVRQGEVWTEYETSGDTTGHGEQKGLLIETLGDLLVKYEENQFRAEPEKTLIN